MLLTMQGTLTGGAGNGSFRIIETHPDARGVCDTALQREPDTMKELLRSSRALGGKR